MKASMEQIVVTRIQGGFANPRFSVQISYDSGGFTERLSVVVEVEENEIGNATKDPNSLAIDAAAPILEGILERLRHR
ncbi:hypothetical protein [Candidatus Rariloculus sp.]|uniref:hypothetical protein n=1 Tax=Candidatus Rariloculus sp. TaxID=3101265 RepID=UPI003D0E749E